MGASESHKELRYAWEKQRPDLNIHYVYKDGRGVLDTYKQNQKQASTENWAV